MQTKQEQRDEFIKKFCPHNTDPVLRIYADFWLQKQDQLLTELGEKLREKRDHRAPAKGRAVRDEQGTIRTHPPDEARPNYQCRERGIQ